MKGKYVLMMSPNKFPEGDAGAVRDHAFACIYMQLGYSVVHIGEGSAARKGNFDGIDFYSIHEKADGALSKAKRLMGYRLRLSETVDAIVGERGAPGLIHVYDVKEPGLRLVKRMSVEHSLPLLHDSVEWYSPCQFKAGRFDYAYWMKDLLNRKLIDGSFSVIAISRYLEDYFVGRGLKTTRIPVIMDATAFRPVIRGSSKVKLVYAGSPAKKDYLAECVKGFLDLDERRRTLFSFDIYGVSADGLKSVMGGGDIPAEMRAHGRVSRNEVLTALAGADFSMLLRPPEERYAKAGFPTKVVEGMMSGCAMLCNVTSDLGEYLVDGENSVLVGGAGASDVTKSLDRIAAMGRERIEAIKASARETAVRCFDYRRYVDQLGGFIDEVLSLQ